jgi:hypothetical protein
MYLTAIVTLAAFSVVIAALGILESKMIGH